MNLDGSEKERLFLREYTAIIMTDTYIFYTLETPESKELNELPGAEDGPRYLGALHRVGLDGEGDVIVTDLITDLNVYANTVYFSDGKDSFFYSLNQETLVKTKIDNVKMVDDTEFADGYMFFITHTDRCFYRMSLKDGTLTLIAHGWPKCRGILDGYVYLDILSGDEPGLFKTKTDGIELEKVK
jgi:hypothetical protein